MVTIKKAKLKDYAELMALEVTEQQQPFVSDFASLYEQRTPALEFYVINKNTQVLGFFIIDIGYSKKYTFAGNQELGLRNLLIGKQFQGHGYGVQALTRLTDYVYGAYPDITSLCLTVNKKNTGAYRCYVKAGFVDSGELYYGGEAGPQHIMRKKIG
jgi:RimJ/RimL family protein N-acetyltransferase